MMHLQVRVHAMDQPTLYEDDAFLWSRQQAALLRDLARTSAKLPNALDLPNIAEEIEGVGLSELNSVRSHLVQLLIHLIKAASSPSVEPRRKWLEEVLLHRTQAGVHFTPGMRQHIDLQDLWVRAGRQTAAALDMYGETLGPLPQDVPFTSDELLGDSVGVEALLRRLRSPSPDMD